MAVAPLGSHAHAPQSQAFVSPALMLPVRLAATVVHVISREVLWRGSTAVFCKIEPILLLCQQLAVEANKERAPLGAAGTAATPPPLAAIWSMLIGFDANRLEPSAGNSWKCCSPNVTSSGPAHERNISLRDAETASQRSQTLPRSSSTSAHFSVLRSSERSV